MTGPLHPDAATAADIVRTALAEDLDAAGDITTNAVVPAGAELRGNVVAREPGVIAGLDISLSAFTIFEPAVAVKRQQSEGKAVAAGATLASVSGPAHAILAAERTCLNLLGHLSGIATATRRLVDLVAHTGVAILDTRKTTPGLRLLEKQAVRVGGGRNHRFGLFDAVLIKDNHLAAAGGVARAVTAARGAVGHTVTVQVEVENLEDLQAAIDSGADAVLLDNMSPARLREAVDHARGRVALEASGGITPATLVEVAESGVDVVSLGWLTHSTRRLDVALDIELPSPKT